MLRIYNKIYGWTFLIWERLRMVLRAIYTPRVHTEMHGISLEIDEERERIPHTLEQKIELADIIKGLIKVDEIRFV